jgi:hypothetical protein
MPYSTSRNSGTTFPLSPGERSRLFRRRFRGPRRRVKLRLSDDKFDALVKRGYLGPNELDDPQAVTEALSLFLWDAILKSPKRPRGCRRIPPAGALKT